MLPLLVLRHLLLEQVRQGIVDAVLLEIRAGDPSGILPRLKVIDLPNLAAILALLDSGGIAHLRRQCDRGHTSDCCQHDGQQQ